MRDPAKLAYFDLSTDIGRKRARHDLFWKDHGFLRVVFANRHRLSSEMWRENQPSPERIARYAKQGIKTVIYLREPRDTGYYLLEEEACAKHGIALEYFSVRSRDIPTKEQLLGSKDLFARIAYPAVMHCKSGADRTGLMGVLYKHWRLGEPIEQAIEQLDGKYLHIRQGKTGIIDFVFETYLKERANCAHSFEDWVKNCYDPPEMKKRFLSSWWANVLVDKLLRRE